MKTRSILTAAVVGALSAVLFGCGQKQQARETGQRAASEVHSEAHHDHTGHGHEGRQHGDPAGKELVPQKTCPVMQGAIDKKLYIDHDGKRVYLCCPACVEEFKKDPAKYLEKLEELGEKPEEI